MKLAYIIAATALLVSVNAEAAGDPAARAGESRVAVKEFFGALKGELVAAIKAGGPVNAIKTCNIEAPAIAASISEKKGWRVARTSLKLRNQSNAPDAWETRVLKYFDKRKVAGDDPTKMEVYQVVDGTFRYMKAIPTAAKPCLACHGEKVPPKVEEALKALYPDDKARGYKAGDIRGAFTISQPM
ncbi:MAG: DUF3365 domain-containing protein [Rhodospirillaceae bacterium]|nr:DUF3365 domain-containing protein [Rhodospirillaceae bacterium]